MLTIHVDLEQKLRKSGFILLPHPPIRRHSLFKGTYNVTVTFSQFKLLCRKNSTDDLNQTSSLLYTYSFRMFLLNTLFTVGTAVAQWLRCCAKNGRSLVRSQLVSLEFFIDIKSFRSHYGPGVDTTCNRNEYQEYFLGVKVAST